MTEEDPRSRAATGESPQAHPRGPSDPRSSHLFASGGLRYRGPIASGDAAVASSPARTRGARQLGGPRPVEGPWHQRPQALRRIVAPRPRPPGGSNPAPRLALRAHLGVRPAAPRARRRRGHRARRRPLRAGRRSLAGDRAPGPPGWRTSREQGRGVPTGAIGTPRACEPAGSGDSDSQPRGEPGPIPTAIRSTDSQPRPPRRSARSPRAAPVSDEGARRAPEDRGLADGLAFPGQSHHRVRSRGVDSEHDRHPTPTSQRAAQWESDALGRATVNRRKGEPMRGQSSRHGCKLTSRRGGRGAGRNRPRHRSGRLRRRRGGGRGGQVRPGGDHNGAGEDEERRHRGRGRGESVGTEAEERVEACRSSSRRNCRTMTEAAAPAASERREAAVRSSISRSSPPACGSGLAG